MVSISKTNREVTAIMYDGTIIDSFSQPVDSLGLQQQIQQEKLNREKRNSE
jgi:hypothetical protein